MLSNILFRLKSINTYMSRYNSGNMSIAKAYQLWIDTYLNRHVIWIENKLNRFDIGNELLNLLSSSGPVNLWHYHDVIMGAMASQITSLIIVYSTVSSGADQRKHQSSASLALAFVLGIHLWPVNSPHKWPVTRKMFPFDHGCCMLSIVWLGMTNKTPGSTQQVQTK